MDLKTSYLGIELPHPLMPGASPLAHDLDKVRELEEAGAAAIVMPSLFEEQLTGDQLGAAHHYESHAESFAEAQSYLPSPTEFALGPDDYLEQIQAIKRETDLVVIGSLNGVTPSGWLEYGRLIEQAGADALELNVYYVASDPTETTEEIEAHILEVIRTVCGAVSIPVAVKLSPFFSALANLAASIEEAGARGLVLFNRFYQPDLDVAELEVVPRLHLSSPEELPLRLHWLAILSGQRRLDLAASGGVHRAADAVRAIAAGAHTVQMVSALLRHGPKHLQIVLQGLREWLEEYEYDSLGQARGALSYERCPDPTAYQRLNYVKVLQSWRW